MSLRVRVGTAVRPHPGERECGDALAVTVAAGRTTIVLADGLGHGPEAARAAKRVVDTVRLAKDDRPLADVMRDVHAALADTRGAAVTLLRVDAHALALEHVGIGNVELCGLTRERIHPSTTAGIAGFRMRKLTATTHRLHAGDLLVLHTDGLSSRFTLEPFRDMEPQGIADALLASHAKEHDDAACVVVRV